MFASNVDSFVREWVKSLQNVFKVFLDSLKKVRGQVENTAEKTAFLDFLEMMCRERQRAANKASGKEKITEMHFPFERVTKGQATSGMEEGAREQWVDDSALFVPITDI